MEDNNNEIVIFENQNVKLKVNMKDEMVVAKFENTTEHGAIPGKSLILTVCLL